MKDQRCSTRLHGPGAFRPAFCGPKNRDGNDRNTCLHREVEWSLLEGKQTSVDGTGAFGKDHHVEPVLHHLGCGTHALDCSFAIGALDRDELRHLHGGAEYRDPEQFTFHQHRATASYSRYKNRRIEVRNMVGHVDVISSWQRV